MSINLKLILGCMAFALLTIAFAVVSQRAHIDLHLLFAQDLAPRQAAILDLEDGRRRAALLEAHLASA